MGLLSVVSSLNSAAATNKSLSDETRKSLKELSSDRMGEYPPLSIPGYVFSQLAKYLEIHYGALLLYDVLEKAYLPWAYYGYDSTTSHRLKIPMSGFQGIMNQGLPFSIQDRALKDFESYFSGRDFGLIEKMVLFPFGNIIKTRWGFPSKNLYLGKGIGPRLEEKHPP